MSKPENSVPPGTVLAYADIQNDPELNMQGWAICDAMPLKVSLYTDLFCCPGLMQWRRWQYLFQFAKLPGLFSAWC